MIRAYENPLVSLSKAGYSTLISRGRGTLGGVGWPVMNLENQGSSYDTGPQTMHYHWQNDAKSSWSYDHRCVNHWIPPKIWQSNKGNLSIWSYILASSFIPSQKPFSSNDVLIIPSFFGGHGCRKRKWQLQTCLFFQVIFKKNVPWFVPL